MPEPWCKPVLCHNPNILQPYPSPVAFDGFAEQLLALRAMQASYLESLHHKQLMHTLYWAAWS